MSESILTSTKRALGIDVSNTDFDPQVLMHINSVFSTLNQLGIGPEFGYMIEDATPTWAAFIGTDPRLNAVKSYMYLRVRLIFDPPTTSYLIDSVKQQFQEMEWRLNAYRESTQWTNPDQTCVPPDVVLDGGSP